MFSVESVAARLLAALLARLMGHALLFLIKFVVETGKVCKQLKELLKICEAVKTRIEVTNMPDDWLNEIAHYFYDLEDIIDDIHLASMKEQKSGFIQRRSLVSRIKELRSNLEKMLLREPDQASTSQSQSSWQEAHQPTYLPLRKEIKDKIIEELNSDESVVSIILGMTGIGKTVLAEHIQRDARIKNNFWCTKIPILSGEFKVENVRRDLKAKKLPTHRKVLIIFDGLQTVDPSHWVSFRAFLHEKLRPGSKVLITSCNPQVAYVTGSNGHEHFLDPLGDDDSFLLIQECANANQNLGSIDIAVIKHYKKELLGKCHGWPRLACRLGLLISAAENRRQKVEEIVKTSHWELLKSENILPDLVSVLQAFQSLVTRCLAYCVLFPRDYTFEKDALVELWTAEGFVPDSLTKNVSYLENTVGQYFEQLRSYSIFQERKDATHDNPSYKMYQLFYDLAESMACKIVRQVHAGTLPPSSSSPARHLSLICPDNENIVNTILDLSGIMTNSKGLRTLLLMKRAGEKIKIERTFFKSLEFVRVLDLSHTNLTTLVSSISSLKHLRYLDLSYTPIQSLPSLAELFALQVLKLVQCTELNCLPNNLSTLTNLVCLHVKMMGFGALPPSIGKLTSLQMLDVFTVGNDEGYKIAELKNMKGLKKSICIRKLENVKNEFEASEAMLHNKNSLETLELEWSNLATNEDEKQSAQEVLQGLRPPRSLRRLTITNYSGNRFPDWLGKGEVSGLLVTIEMYHCETCSILPSFGQLEALKTLRIVAMYDLKQVGDEFYGEGHSTIQSQAFPALESLEFSDLPELTEWGELGTGCMPLLRDLKINHCKKLVNLPALNQLTSLKELEINWCEELKELPTLPTSMKAGGQLSIDNCKQVEERYNIGGPDRAKIEFIPSVLINGMQTVPTASASSALQISRNVTRENAGSSSQNPTPAPPQSVKENLTKQDHPKHAHDAQNRVSSGAKSSPSTSEPGHGTPILQDNVSANQPQPQKSTKVVGESIVSQVHQDGVPTSQNFPSASGPGDQTHNSQKQLHNNHSESSDEQKPSSSGFAWNCFKRLHL